MYDLDKDEVQLLQHRRKPKKKCCTWKCCCYGFTTAFAFLFCIIVTIALILGVLALLINAGTIPWNNNFCEIQWTIPLSPDVTYDKFYAAFQEAPYSKPLK